MNMKYMSMYTYLGNLSYDGLWMVVATKTEHGCVSSLRRIKFVEHSACLQTVLCVCVCVDEAGHGCVSSLQWVWIFGCGRNHCSSMPSKPLGANAF